jgi:arylsulfatase A-like enzyme
VLQLDNLLAAFFRDLDRRLGKEAFVAVLTSDHGFMAAPEYLQAKGQDGGRLPPGQLRAKLNAALSGQFGEGQWATAWSAQGIFLDQALAAQRGVDARLLEAAANKALRAEPGVADVLTRAEIEGREKSASPWLSMVRKAWHPERSADLQIVLKPGWMWSSGRTGATHGSPYAYDTHVPLLFYGPKWVKPGRRDARVEIADIAPTLAALLGVPAPSSSEGRPLDLAP